MPNNPLESLHILGYSLGPEWTLAQERPQRLSSTPSAPSLFLPQDIDHVRLLARWIVVAIVLGTLSAVVVHAVRELLLFFASLRAPAPGPLLFTLPAMGGIANGVCIFRVDREARGDGIYTYIKRAAESESRLGARFVLLKVLATLITIGSGARGGLVGPLVAINAGLGLTLARWVPFVGRFLTDPETELRPSAICGAAGAVGALLLTPLGGGIFAVEILFGGSLAYAALFPAILTSTTAFFVSALLRGGFPTVVWSDLRAPVGPDASSVVIVLVTAVVAGFAGILFVYLNKRLPYLLERWRAPVALRPAIGGLLCGVVALLVGREVLYSGTDLFGQTIPDLLNTAGAFPIGRLVLLLLGIGLAVGFTVGGSGSGGLTMPAMTLGVLSGAVVASVFSASPADSLPSLVAGMTAFLASSLNVPIAAAVISLELFGMGPAYAAVLGSIIGYQMGRGHLMYRYLQKGG